MRRQTDCSAKAPTMLILADAFPVPTETFIADHIRGMASAGWDVTLMVRQRRTDWQNAESSLGECVKVVTPPAAGIAQYLQAACWQIRHPNLWANLLAWKCALHGARIAASPIARKKWDVVHAHYGNNGVSALIARSDWLTRLIVNFHGTDATATPKRYGWHVYQQILGTAHAVAHSEFVARLLLENTHLLVHRVTMGVDLERFSAPTKPSTWPTPLKLLCVGRLSVQKGQAVAIDALRLLRTRHPELDMRLTLVGTGPEQTRLQAQAEALGLSNYVYGLEAKHHSELPSVYADAHVLLVPSQITPDGSQEAFCRVAIEGMACGLPVAGTPGGGLPDTIGEGGLVTTGFEARDLAVAVARIVERDNPSHWAEVVRTQARRYSIDKMNIEYAQLAHLVAVSSGNVDAY